MDLPNLKIQHVKPDQLLLDPNNPRLTVSESDLIPENQFADPAIQAKTLAKLTENDTFQISALMESIYQHGFLPIDRIFIRKHADNKFIVLEGNRRVAVLKQILGQPAKLPKDQASRDKILESIRTIECAEIEPDGLSDAELARKISHILGLRHQGSLKQWSPFAQAGNIYETYLKYASQSPETFAWDAEMGKQIARAFSVKLKTVESHIAVYRSMQQVGSLDAVKRIDGVKSNHYSLFLDILKTEDGKRYFEIDSHKFILSKDGASKFDRLCHFSTVDRKGSPIVAPNEWRYFIRILNDEDLTRREQMLSKVIEEKQKPSDVSAEREMELRKPRWDLWLADVAYILRNVSIGQIQGTKEEKQTISKISTLVSALGKQGGSNPKKPKGKR